MDDRSRWWRCGAESSLLYRRCYLHQRQQKRQTPHECLLGAAQNLASRKRVTLSRLSSGENISSMANLSGERPRADDLEDWGSTAKYKGSQVLLRESKLMQEVATQLTASCCRVGHTGCRRNYPWIPRYGHICSTCIDGSDCFHRHACTTSA